MATSNYIAYGASTEKSLLSEEQIAVFADQNSPIYLVSAFDCAAANVHNQDKIQAVFKTWEGLRWGDQPERLFCAVAKFFRPGYQHHIMQDRLPPLEGIIDKLKQGASVADVGCGHGLGLRSGVRRTQKLNSREWTSYLEKADPQILFLSSRVGLYRTLDSDAIIAK